jgi:hypothetical protein
LYITVMYLMSMDMMLLEFLPLFVTENGRMWLVVPDTC